MSGSLNDEIEVWEGEGGSASGTPGACATAIGGTAAQAEWEERIQQRVNDEVDGPKDRRNDDFDGLHNNGG